MPLFIGLPLMAEAFAVEYPQEFSVSNKQGIKAVGRRHHYPQHFSVTANAAIVVAGVARRYPSDFAVTAPASITATGPGQQYPANFVVSASPGISAAGSSREYPSNFKVSASEGISVAGFNTAYPSEFNVSAPLGIQATGTRLAYHQKFTTNSSRALIATGSTPRHPEIFSVSAPQPIKAIAMAGSSPQLRSAHITLAEQRFTAAAPLLLLGQRGRPAADISSGITVPAPVANTRAASMKFTAGRLMLRGQHGKPIADGAVGRLGEILSQPSVAPVGNLLFQAPLSLQLLGQRGRPETVIDLKHFDRGSNASAGPALGNSVFIASYPLLLRGPLPGTVRSPIHNFDAKQAVQLVFQPLVSLVQVDTLLLDGRAVRPFDADQVVADIEQRSQEVRDGANANGDNNTGGGGFTAQALPLSGPLPISSTDGQINLDYNPAQGMRGLRLFNEDSTSPMPIRRVLTTAGVSQGAVNVTVDDDYFSVHSRRPASDVLSTPGAQVLVVRDFTDNNYLQIEISIGDSNSFGDHQVTDLRGYFCGAEPQDCPL